MTKSEQKIKTKSKFVSEISLIGILILDTLYICYFVDRFRKLLIRVPNIFDNTAAKRLKAKKIRVRISWRVVLDTLLENVKTAS